MSLQVARWNKEEGLRAALVGELPLADWARHGSGAPWSQFADAARRPQAHDRAGAVGVLERIAATPGLESRHYLEAWFALRQLGLTPRPEIADRLYGVVVEVGLSSGVDLLGIYADHTARYINNGGGVVVWDHPDTSLDRAIDEVFGAATAMLSSAQPEETQAPPPEVNQARLDLLTPGGVRVLVRSLSNVAGDAAAGPVFSAATSVMLLLLDKVPEAG